MKSMILALALLIFSPVTHAETSASYIQEHAISFTDELPPGLVSAMDGKPLVFLGEVHGTNEFPGIALRLITKLADKKPLLVGLEFPTDIQAQIDRFMETGDFNILKETRFFTDANYHSGRGSVAMVNLLVALRSLPGVSVFCFDIPFGFKGNDRDTKMAENILAEAARQPNRPMFVYTGNLHSRLVPGAPWDPNYVTMGAEVLRLSAGKYNLKDSESIYLRYDQGSAWQCIQEQDGKIACNERSFGPGNSVYATAVPYDAYFLPEPGLTDGHQAALFLRTVSASPPF